MGHLVFSFEDLSCYDDEDCTEQRELCNANTPIAANSLNGTVEANFCRIFSDLAGKSIQRNEPNLFLRRLESKKKVFYLNATIGHNNCQIYPLKNGLFITPKPMRFIPLERIKYFEYTRACQSLKYHDLAIILYPEHKEEEKDDAVPGNDTKKKKKSKKNANKIELNMVDKRESASLCQYFALLRIEQKKAGMESPD